MNDIICEESFDVVLGQGKHGTRVQPFSFCKHRSRTSAVGCFLRQTPWSETRKKTHLCARTLKPLRAACSLTRRSCSRIVRVVTTDREHAERQVAQLNTYARDERIRCWHTSVLLWPVTQFSTLYRRRHRKLLSGERKPKNLLVQHV